ncbi:MAG: nucleoside triphosphate pyrophosphohydrolase [Acidobacteria bacterium]|nr:nucleoside triphosphate pyrophosphohydrolase [Acidobacteriota bacterium]
MVDEDPLSPTDLARLTRLVARLRAPDGCPWDREQTLPTVRAYLLEEAHETAAAIDHGAAEALRGELGDLLFQAAFIARLAEESGAFELGDAIEHVRAKMVARHPHVFGGEELATAAEVRDAWERRKLRDEGNGRKSLLDGAAAASMPALLAAYRLTQKAAGVGFDWPDAAAVLDKLDEEVGELRAELVGDAAPTGERLERAREELGDLLFTVANLARKLEIDPEAALAGTLIKFRRRFGHVERELAARGRELGEATLEEMDALWEEAKRSER